MAEPQEASFTVPAGKSTSQAMPIASGPHEAEPDQHHGFWLALGAGFVVLALCIWYLMDRKVSAPQPAVEAQVSAPVSGPIPAPVPPGYQDTLRQAQAGDVAAMRTLGAVYTYGLGVPAHREEGLRWYRKAAEAGSSMAAQEAKAIENGSVK